MSTLERTQINIADEFVKNEIQVGILKWQNSDLYRRLETLDKKIDNKFTVLDSKIDNKFINLETKMDSKFSWLYGIIAAAVIAILAPILSNYYNPGPVHTVQEIQQQTR